MTRPVIFLPEPFPAKSLEVVPDRFEIRQGDATRRYEEDELIAALQGVTALAITSREQVTARAIEAAGDLKVIGKTGARPVNVDMTAAEARGIAVVWSPTANSRSVAEMTLGLMLMLVKRVPEMAEILRSGGWRNYDVLGRELAAMTVGLVGLGNVGKAVARLLNAIGARVIAHDPGIDPAKAAEMGVEWVPLDALLARAEMISLHCDLDEKTSGIVGEAAFAAMGEGTYLVNTARGALVDTTALLGALDSGRVVAAALDVFSIEPLPTGDPVVAHPRIIATPHVSAFTEEAIHRETAWVLEDIVDLLDGKAVRHRSAGSRDAADLSRTARARELRHPRE